MGITTKRNTIIITMVIRNLLRIERKFMLVKMMIHFNAMFVRS